MSDVGAGDEIRDHCHTVAPKRSRRSLDLQAIHPGDRGRGISWRNLGFA
jgi:hypothetical protein